MDAGGQHVSRRIHFSGEMWLNRLGDRSSCDGTFFLKVNRYKLSLCGSTQKLSNEVDSFRKYVEYATAFVKYAG
jgi:hypothetical protein